MYSTSWLRCHLEIVIGINFTVFVSINSEFKHCWRRLWRKKWRNTSCKTACLDLQLMPTLHPHQQTYASSTNHRGSFQIMQILDLIQPRFASFHLLSAIPDTVHAKLKRASRWIVERYSDWSYRKEQHTMLYHWGLTYLPIRYVFLHWGTLMNYALPYRWADCIKVKVRQCCISYSQRCLRRSKYHRFEATICYNKLKTKIFHLFIKRHITLQKEPLCILDQI